MQGKIVDRIYQKQTWDYLIYEYNDMVLLSNYLVSQIRNYD